MLEQEGLSEIAHSNASEQIAYLLVERTTLLEKLEIADQKWNSHSCIDRLCAARLQVPPAAQADWKRVGEKVVFEIFFLSKNISPVYEDTVDS